MRHEVEKRAKFQRWAALATAIALGLGGNCPAQGPQKAAAEPAAPARLRPQDFEAYSGYARTKLFGLEAQGNKFVYVFDRSGSMGEFGGRPLREAKAELLNSLKDLDERQQFYIVFYNEEPRLFEAGVSKGRLVFATPDNKQQAENFVEGIRADGGTNHLSALSIAVRLRPDVIFLLTDGEDKDDPTADDLRRIDRLNGGGATIHVIQFAKLPRTGGTLEQLAKQNRGEYLFVDIEKLGEAKTKAAAGPRK